MRRHVKTIISRMCIVALLITLVASSAVIVSAEENVGPFTTNFIAPEKGDDITKPGGVFTENADGSMAINPGENPWHEYRLYKNPVKAKDGSYSVELTYNGEFPTWGSIGIAVGIESLSPVCFGEGPQNSKSSNGLFVRFVNTGENYSIVPDGKNKEGDWIYVNGVPVITAADYSATTAYTIKIVVKDTTDAELRQADIYVDSALVCENITFKPSGPYIGLIGQQNRGTVIHNIKINGEVIAGVNYVEKKSEQEPDAASIDDVDAVGSDDSAVQESPRTGDMTSPGLMAAMMLAALVVMAAVSAFKKGSVKLK